MSLNLKILKYFNGKHPKLIMFDLDGTLVHSLPDIAWSVDSVLRKMNYPEAGEALVSEWIGNGSAKLIERALQYAEPDEIKRRSLQTRALETYLQVYSQHLAVSTFCFPGVIDVLEHLKKSEKYILAIVTNKPYQMAVELLDTLGIAHFFQDVLGGDSLQEKKPHPAPLVYLAGKYQVRADQALMVGDSKSDILAAKAAGCPCISVSYGYHQGEDLSLLKPDMNIDSFPELI